MKTEKINFVEHLDNCRLIASRMVSDVKLYPNGPLRLIINAYWESLPRLEAKRAEYTLELFKTTDMGSMATFYAEVAIRDCIISANERDYHNPSEEFAEECKHEIRAFARMLEESAEFYKQMEEEE